MSTCDGYSIHFLLDCFERGRVHGNQCPASICMVPNVIRDVNPSCYNPRTVSIGPLHKENKKQKESQGLKESYLHDLVEGLGSTPDQILKECLQNVYDSIDKIKASYDGIENIRDEDLANMMVMDGCFILEFFRKRLSPEYVSEFQDYLITMDLFLVENQIPFFVLQNLSDCTLKKKVPSDSLTEIVINVFAPCISLFGDIEFASTNIATDSTHDHLLGCLHKVFHPSGAKPKAGIYKRVPSATELDRSGVNFKAHQDQNYPMTMKFESSAFSCFNHCWGKPTLLVPKINIYDETERILRNYIAYEQCFPHIPCYFTSYAYAMDMLINTEEDIVKLIESKVIENNLGSKTEAAHMFNKLCKDVTLPDFYYKEEFKQLNKYYNGICPKYIAWLRRTYFSNPWSTIALFAAIILFVLAVVQTLFTILGVV